MLPTEFFARRKLSGNNLCYYCGGICNDDYHIRDYVKSTFSNRDIVASLNSEFVCENCVICFSENLTIQTVDEIREKQRIRSYSWIVTENKNIAYTKTHIKQLRELILNPPDPPFMIVLADSGQKHLIFRSKIAYSKDFYPVNFETEIITVDIQLLNDCIELLKPIIAACGKSILNKMEQNINTIALLVFKRFPQSAENYIEKLIAVKNKQLLKLAAWLSDNKEVCNAELFNI